MKVICIGLNHSGVTVVKTLVQKLDTASVVGYERDEHLAFLSCGAALLIKGTVKNIKHLAQTTVKELKELGVDAKTSHEVVQIDSQNQRIKVKNLLTGKIFWDTYDKLVFSGGSQPFLPSLPNVDLDGIFVAKSFVQVDQLLQYLDKPHVKRIAVVGTGYVGIEFAEAFFKKKKEVLMFDRTSRVMSTYFEPEFTDLVEAAIRKKKGISLHLGKKVCSFEGSAGKVTHVVTDQGKYQVDMVVCCLGSVPNTKLLKDLVEMTPKNYIKVNHFLQTSDPNIYACGDCISVFDNSCQLKRNIGLASNSVRTGLVTALNIAHNNQHSFCGVQGTSAVCVFGWKLFSTGINSQLADKLKLPYKTTFFEDQVLLSFMDSDQKVKIKLLWNTENRKIIGCQIASQHNHSEAIYFFSLAIMKGLTVDELPTVDLFFLPHFNKPDNFITQVGLKSLGINLKGI